MPGSPKWSLFFRFPHHNPLHASPLPQTRYMPRSAHSSQFYHPNNIGWGVQIFQLLIMQFPPPSCYLVPPMPIYSPQHPILKHPQPAFLPQCQWPSFKPIQNNRQNYSSAYLNFCFLDSNLFHSTISRINTVRMFCFIMTRWTIEQIIST